MHIVCSGHLVKDLNIIRNYGSTFPLPIYISTDSESTTMDKIELEPLKKDSEDLVESDQDEDPEIRDEDDIEKGSESQDDVEKGYDDGYYGPAQPLVIVP